MPAGKQGTHSKGFPENIIKFLSALSIPASKRPQLLTKHAWRHRRYRKNYFFMYFKSVCIINISDSNKIQTRNQFANGRSTI